MSRAVSKLFLAGMILLSTLSSAAENPPEPPDSYCTDPHAGAACKLYSVSMAALISNPEIYEGRRIATAGYLHLEFEGNAIYFNRDDHTHNIHQNGLWVYLSKDITSTDDLGSCKSDKYVHVVGTFSAKSRGHMGLWSGSINIERCYVSFENK